MPNHESLLQACYAPYPVSSSVTLDTLYRGRDLAARQAKSVQQVRQHETVILIAPSPDTSRLPVKGKS
jgi:hypothetical protein